MAGLGQENYGYLAKNVYNLGPFVGINVLPFSDVLNVRWPAHVLSVIEGDENSTARRMIEFIENSHKEYKQRDVYHFIGPNSNTYVQWVLEHFPEFNARLPWNAIGKGYEVL
jgi:hypothetical protein